MVGQQITCPVCANLIIIPAPAMEMGSATVPVAPVGVSPTGARPTHDAPDDSRIPNREVFGGTPQNAGETPRAPRKRRAPIFALVAAFVLIGAVAAALFIFRGQGGTGLNVLSALTGPAPSDLRVYPTNVNLTTKGDRQSVVVQAIYADGLTRDVTGDADFMLVNKSLAKVEKGIVTPLADGKTDLQVKYGGKQITLSVAVAQAKVERPVSFNLDVMPVFMKAGCNAGSCHGSSRGKDGFRLSLFGYDPEGDYFRLTREYVGRRINLALPGESLMIEKGLGKVPHGGGERFKADSELNQTLMRWLEAGVPKDGTNLPKVVSVEMLPKQAVLDGSNSTQRVMVRATYSDGTDRDVTTLAAFFSNNDPVAKVSEDGVVKAGQRGEAYVTARFETHTVGAQMLVVPKGL
jgi:hypothetical protein